MLAARLSRYAGSCLVLLALAACSRTVGGSSDEGRTERSRSNQLVKLGPGTFVGMVNARCVELDKRKTALYRDALADDMLTIPEYRVAEAAYQPRARSFDAEIAKLATPTAADVRARGVLTAYITWVGTRRQVLDGAAAKGNEMAFTAALEQSNVGFFESEQVRAMKAEGFVTACLSR